MSRSSTTPSGPPYVPRSAAVGGQPNLSVDVPITSVFLALYIALAATHMTIFRRNWSRGHHFLISWGLFGFCMARVITCALRISWAAKPNDIPIAIAATIFYTAGVVVLYVVNLLFAHRILCAQHPKLGWNRKLHWAFVVVYALTGVAILMLISMIVLSFYTLNKHTLQAARDTELAFITWITVTAVLAPVVLICSMSLPKPGETQHFGEGNLNFKAGILVGASVLCLMIAGFRIGTGFAKPRPRDDPAWWESKASFYCFGFMLEVMTVLLYVIVRVDKRFHVPEGSNKRRTYLQEEDATRRVDSRDSGATQSSDTDDEKAEKAEV